MAETIRWRCGCQDADHCESPAKACQKVQRLEDALIESRAQLLWLVPIAERMDLESAWAAISDRERDTYRARAQPGATAFTADVTAQLLRDHARAAVIACARIVDRDCRDAGCLPARASLRAALARLDATKVG